MARPPIEPGPPAAGGMLVIVAMLVVMVMVGIPAASIRIGHGVRIAE